MGRGHEQEAPDGPKGPGSTEKAAEVVGRATDTVDSMGGKGGNNREDKVAGYDFGSVAGCWIVVGRSVGQPAREIVE